jgi:hypothetical protein
MAEPSLAAKRISRAREGSGGRPLRGTTASAAKVCPEKTSQSATKSRGRHMVLFMTACSSVLRKRPGLLKNLRRRMVAEAGAKVNIFL